MGRAVHCPIFYDRLQNPDYALFQSARDDSTNSTFLYITDGVQSDWRGSNPGPSLGLLKEWLTDGRAFAVLVFRSHFEGPVWSEQAQRMLPAAITDRRPFYLFVLAPTETQIDDLLRRLSSRTLSSAIVLRFSPDGISCHVTPAKRLLKYRSQSGLPWVMVQYPRLEAIGNAVRVPMDYTCDVGTGFPVDRVSPRMQVSYRKWQKGRFEAPSEPLPGTSLRAESDTSSVTASTMRVAVVPIPSRG
jgi:hypothetical protein